MKRSDPRHGSYAGAKWREQSRAQSKALWKLVELHPEEFRRLYDAEKAVQS